MGGGHPWVELTLSSLRSPQIVAKYDQERHGVVHPIPKNEKGRSREWGRV